MGLALVAEFVWVGYWGESLGGSWVECSANTHPTAFSMYKGVFKDLG